MLIEADSHFITFSLHKKRERHFGDVNIVKSLLTPPHGTADGHAKPRGDLGIVTSAQHSR